LPEKLDKRIADKMEEENNLLRKETMQKKILIDFLTGKKWV
jgi:hypothetical protein